MHNIYKSKEDYSLIFTLRNPGKVTLESYFSVVYTMGFIVDNIVYNFIHSNNLIRKKI